MVVVVTRNVPDRFRGFLASCMLELAPGVYTGPGMSRAVRERVWKVLEEWWSSVQGAASIIMTWRQDGVSGGQGIAQLGLPPHELVEHDGMVLVRRELPTAVPAETQQPLRDKPIQTGDGLYESPAPRDK